MKTQHHFYSVIVSLILPLCIGACSTTKSNETTETVQTGTVIAIERTNILDNSEHPTHRRRNVGVSIGSGGHSGIYGSVDLATIGGIFNQPKKVAYMQKITVKRSNGSLVEITQAEREHFYKGDKVKIVLLGNQAKVVH